MGSSGARARARVPGLTSMMARAIPTRRKSDDADFVQTDLDIDAIAEDIFSRYVGEQDIVVDGSPYTTTFFRREYCPDFRVMKLAGHLALAVNRQAARDKGSPDAIR